MTSDPKKLRLAFLIDRWQPNRGGAEAALARFAGHLEERGHEIVAVGLEGPRQNEEAPGRFLAVTTHGWTRGGRERRLAEAMLATAKANHCDAIVGVRHLPEADFYWPHGGAHAATLRAMRKRGRGRHRVFLDLERRALADGGARRVVCVSELVREELLDHYPTAANRLVVVPNGIDLERFHPSARHTARAALLAELGWPEGAPILCFVGSNAKLKGLPRLLAALEPLRDQPWRLLVAGPRRVRRWARRAKKRGFAGDRVAVRERLDGVLLAAGTDLAVVPSLRDPCSLVTLEALACGTPVVVSSAVGAREAVASEEAGVVVSARGKKRELTEALAAQLQRLQRRAPDRDAVRAGVLDRGLEPWLRRLEGLLLEMVD